MELKNINREWLFIALACFLIFVDFLGASGMPTNSMHSDHMFHLPKFTLASDHGITTFPEMGNVSLLLLLPPFLLPFIAFALVFPPALVYFGTYFAILAMTFFASNYLLKKDKLKILLAVLFPITAVSFFRVGRLLELMAHLPLLLLLAYLDEEDNSIFITTLLFIIGATTHLPTLLFYGPIYLFKLFEKKRLKHLFYWSAALIPWLAVYLPTSFGLTGWVLSRVEEIVLAVSAFLSSVGLGWISSAAILIIVSTTIIVPFLGKNGRYAFPSFIMSNIPSVLVYYGIMWPAKLPGINQVIFTTGMPVFSYLLLEKYRKLWTKLAFVSLIILAIPVSWEGPLLDDVEQLAWIDGQYATVHFPVEGEALRMALGNYLAYNNQPSPICTTWEYSDPDWWFYSPQNCGEFRNEVEYLIFPKGTEWVKNCGTDYMEGDHIIVVKTA